MKLRILSVGHKMPDWVETACAEYIKRMPRELTIEIVEIKPEKRAAGNNIENIQATEAKRLLEAAGKDYLIACDEHGIQITSIELAEMLKNWQTLGKNVSFLIGGADGLDAHLKKQANQIIRLSNLTFPHAFVRVLLCEQLFRSQAILQSHPYHRE